MTTVLEGGEGVNVTPRPLFTLVKTRYPLHRRLSGPQGWSGQVGKISPPPGLDPRTVQPVATELPGPLWITNCTKMVVGLWRSLCATEYKFEANITFFFSCPRHDVILGGGVTDTLFLDSGNRPQVNWIPRGHRDQHPLNSTPIGH
jgi:hypothetical protein